MVIITDIANGSVRGTLDDFPDVRTILSLGGIYIKDDLDSNSLATICKLIVREASLSKRVGELEHVLDWIQWSGANYRKDFTSYRACPVCNQAPDWMGPRHGHADDCHLNNLLKKELEPPQEFLRRSLPLTSL